MKFRDRLSHRRYAVSSFGRVASFVKALEEDGKFLIGVQEQSLVLAEEGPEQSTASPAAL